MASSAFLNLIFVHFCVHFVQIGGFLCYVNSLQSGQIDASSIWSACVPMSNTWVWKCLCLVFRISIRGSDLTTAGHDWHLWSVKMIAFRFLGIPLFGVVRRPDFSWRKKGFCLSRKSFPLSGSFAEDVSDSSRSFLQSWWTQITSLHAWCIHWHLKIKDLVKSVISLPKRQPSGNFTTKKFEPWFFLNCDLTCYWEDALHIFSNEKMTWNKKVHKFWHKFPAWFCMSFHTMWYVW